MPNIGGPELLLILAVSAPFGGIAALIAWRRGGSGTRIAAISLIGLIPYLGWVVAFALAFTTRRQSTSAATPAALTGARARTMSDSSFCGKCGSRRAASDHQFCRACGAPL